MAPASRSFRDRAEAGRLLAERLRRYQGRTDTIILGLPRGGVPVAFEVAQALDAPLDVFTVRKLGVPGHEELAMGAIATGGVRVLNKPLLEQISIPTEWIEAIDAKERRELERRERAYRGDKPPPDVAGRTVILVDDGLATGSTMAAAVRTVRLDDPARVVVAVPVADPDVLAALEEEADEAVCSDHTPAARRRRRLVRRLHPGQRRRGPGTGGSGRTPAAGRATRGAPG